MHHKGETAYKTLLGFFVTVGIFGLIVFNFINLFTGFLDGSTQEEKSNFQVYDRQNSPVYNLTENRVHMALFPY